MAKGYFMESIGQRLRKLRKKRDLSVKQISQLTGIPITTYREWEYGRAIKGEPYPKLAEVFGVTLSELMTGKIPASKEILGKLSQIQTDLGEVERNLRSFF
jgi:transcriptional regulator with XRE-family HTH domain